MNQSPRPSRRTRAFLTLAALVVIVIAATGAILAAGRTGDGRAAPDPGSVEAIAEQLAKGQAQERAELNISLAAAAEEAHGHLALVLQGLASAVPLDSAATQRPAGVADVDGWKRDLELAASALETVPEGTSELTVARAAFIGATELLETAAASYGQLLAGPVDQQESLALTVAERREAAVRLWQAGAAQLDTLTIESGGGHVHVFLAPNGNPDDIPAEYQEEENRER